MSWDRTAQILFKPLIPKKWIMLGIIIMLAGQMGGFNFNISGNKKNFEKAMNLLTQKAPLSSTVINETAATDLTASKGLDIQRIRSLPIFSDPRSAALLVLIVGGVLLLLGLLLFLWMWVNANFSFVFIESVVKNDASLRVPFHRNKLQGNSYLMWNVLFSSAAVLLLSAIIIPPVIKMVKLGMFRGDAAFDIVKVFSIIAPYIPLLISSIIALIVISVIVIDFILPIMYRKRMGITKAWPVFLGLFWKNLGGILLYFLVKLGLTILAILISVGLVIVSVFLFLLIGGISWLLGWLIYLITPPAAKAAVLAVLLTLGICLSAVLIILFSLLFLPIPVFFRVFPIYVLGSMDESLDSFTPVVPQTAVVEDVERYKKSMALVWFTVLSPLIIAALALLAAIAIPNFMSARQKTLLDLKRPAVKGAASEKAVIPKDDKVTVYLKNGNSFKAKIERESANNVSFSIEGGSFILPRSDILRIER